MASHARWSAAAAAVPSTAASAAAGAVATRRLAGGVTPLRRSPLSVVSDTEASPGWRGSRRGSWESRTQNVGMALAAGVGAGAGATKAGDEAGAGAEEGSIYSHPKLYELAFGARDFDAEVKFLAQLSELHGTGPLNDLLELGAGPAWWGRSSSCVGVQGSGLRVHGSWFMVQGLWFRVQGSGFRVQGLGFMGFKVHDLRSMG